MGLRFSYVAGWGWVVENRGRIAGRAHPLEKSALIFMSTSIHRLNSPTIQTVSKYDFSEAHLITFNANITHLGDAPGSRCLLR
jgi:hypothetical protein